MRRAALPLILAAIVPAPGLARETVDASAPVDLSVTIYRDPNRSEGEEMNRSWPQGFAMISETRDITLPSGESTVRFEGVAEGMVAVSAIVTGLPGGTIEKNRNADLLSPAALVDGTLGNRVTITRTNPATGQAASQSAIVSSRADGGLVLQTAEGYEAVRCSGLPEKLTFDRVPEGLSAKPVFSIDTHDADGGTYRITLTYLAWGFDWQAHYVATLDDPSVARGRSKKQQINLLSWLTVLNDNNQGFADATLLAVAGTLQITSDLQQLAQPPTARPLRLVCYPLGSTAAGSPLSYPAPPPPVAAMAPMMDNAIVVTASRREKGVMESAVAVTAQEEQLGDLKLYRVPERMTVAAKGLKQVAFLQRDEVQGSFLYRHRCPADDLVDDPEPMEILLKTKNDKEHGLGVALPMGGITVFEPSASGDLLVGEEDLRDYAVGQDIEIPLGESAQVFVTCGAEKYDEDRAKWTPMVATLSNANSSPVKVRLVLGETSYWQRPKGVRGIGTRDGDYVFEIAVPANGRREFRWKMRQTDS